MMMVRLPHLDFGFADVLKLESEGSSATRSVILSKGRILCSIANDEVSAKSESTSLLLLALPVDSHLQA